MIKKSKLLIGTVILVLTSFTGCNKTPIKNNIKYVVEASPSPSPVVAGDNISISSKGTDLNQNSATSQRSVSSGTLSSRTATLRRRGKTETDFSPNSLKGLWINKTYLSNIKKERAPLKAFHSMKDEQMLTFSITHEDLGWRFLGTYSFHQPCHDGTIKKISKDNEGVLHIALDAQGTAKSIMDFQLVDNQVLRLLKGGKTVDYLRVSESDVVAEKYISKLLFAGYACQDSSGYRFDENAEATRKGVKLDYKINLDPFETRCDYIVVKSSNNNEVYAFKFQDDKLYLYNTGKDKTGFLDRLNTTPIAVLTKSLG